MNCSSFKKTEPHRHSVFWDKEGVCHYFSHHILRNCFECRFQILLLIIPYTVRRIHYPNLPQQNKNSGTEDLSTKYESNPPGL